MRRSELSTLPRNRSTSQGKPRRQRRALRCGDGVQGTERGGVESASRFAENAVRAPARLATAKRFQSVRRQKLSRFAVAGCLAREARNGNPQRKEFKPQRKEMKIKTQGNENTEAERFNRVGHNPAHGALLTLTLAVRCKLKGAFVRSSGSQYHRIPIQGSNCDWACRADLGWRQRKRDGRAGAGAKPTSAGRRSNREACRLARQRSSA